MYSVIFGFFFWNYLADFIKQGMEMQMMGQAQPMNMNEQIIRPLLGQQQLSRAVLYPAHHHAPLCRREAQRHHRAARHFARPRYRDHPRQVVGRDHPVLLARSLCRHQLRLPLPLRQSRLEAHAGRLPRRLPAGRGAAGHRHVYLHADEKSDHRRCPDLRRLPAALGLLLGQQLRLVHVGAGSLLYVRHHSLRIPSAAACSRPKTRSTTSASSSLDSSSPPARWNPFAGGRNQEWQASG